MFFRLPPDFFIKKNITTLSKNILILSKEEINNHLKELYKLTQAEFFEISILNKLLQRIQKKKIYYFQKQYARYDWSMTPSIITTFVLLLITLIIYYYACIYYDWLEKNRFIPLSIIAFLCTFYTTKRLYFSLHQWYHPRYDEYKQYYDKLSFIEKKLKNKINNLRKKFNEQNNTKQH